VVIILLVSTASLSILYWLGYNGNALAIETGTLIVIKHVVNISSGQALAANFTMIVNGTNVSTPSFPGNENGTTVTLDAGFYNVTETGPGGYLQFFSADCSGIISQGDTKTCTITNGEPSVVLPPIDPGITPIIINIIRLEFPSGMIWEIGGFSGNGTVNITIGPTNGTTTGSSGGFVNLLGEIAEIQVELSDGVTCSNDNGGCYVFSIFNDTHLTEAGANLNEIRILHDANHDLNLDPDGESVNTTLVDKDGNSPPILGNGPYTANTTGISNFSTFAAGGINSLVTIIPNIVNNNVGNATASEFTITLKANNNQFFETFSGSQTGTSWEPPEGIYTITVTAPAGYLFKSISGQGCPELLGQQFQFSKGHSIICTITYDDIVICPSLSNPWIIATSCTLTTPTTALGNVIVQSGAVLTIPNGVTLDINFSSKQLLVKSGGGVLIKSGGKIF